MKDKWMNMGYEEEELKPFIEPIADLSDEKRIDTLVNITINVNSLIRLYKSTMQYNILFIWEKFKV
jgi:MAP/microtubule affinity-regulating kinase